MTPLALIEDFDGSKLKYYSSETKGLIIIMKNSKNIEFMIVNLF